MVRVREEEGIRQIEQVKEEASRVREERNRVREEGKRVANMAERVNRQAKELATQQAEERRVLNEEVERLKQEGSRREDEVLKRAEDATKKAQEAIAAALAGKEEAEQRSTNLMEEVEERIRKAVEEAMMGVEQRKGNPHTERQWRIMQNSEVPDSDTDVEVVQHLVQIPTAVSSNRSTEEQVMNPRVVQVTFPPNFNSFFRLTVLPKVLSKKLVHAQSTQMSRLHFEEDSPTFTETPVGIDDAEIEGMGTSLQGEEDEDEDEDTGKGNIMEEDVEMGMYLQDEGANETTMENEVSSFSAFSNILAQCSSKDSATKEIFCASRRGCASQHPSTTCTKGPI